MVLSASGAGSLTSSCVSSPSLCSATSAEFASSALASSAFLSTVSAGVAALIGASKFIAPSFSPSDMVAVFSSVAFVLFFFVVVNRDLSEDKASRKIMCKLRKEKQDAFFY